MKYIQTLTFVALIAGYVGVVIKLFIAHSEYVANSAFMLSSSIF